MTSYWTKLPRELAASLGVSTQGLSSEDAGRRLAEYGANQIHVHAAASRIRVLWRQVRSPLILLLAFAAAISLCTGEWLDASVVLAILVLSIGIGYWREHRAEAAIAALLARIEMTAVVVRDGAQRSISVRHVVPGDVLVLAAGTIVSADALLLDTNELHVDEGVLTGESFPVLKKAGPSPADAALRERRGCVHFGTNVRSGSGHAIAVATGRNTAFGSIANRLASRAPETEFERGLRRFGLMLLVAMLVMVVVVLAVNVMLGRPVIDTLLFAIALAVGLSPELLPAIVGVNLSRSAQTLASAGVLVRRLDAIENLGSMNILCTDKTGTLTEGVVRVDGAFDRDGKVSERVMHLALANAALQAGLPNPMDTAILEGRAFDIGRVEKLAEIPYDFSRKRVSVVMHEGDQTTLVMKGAVSSVLETCALEPDARQAIDALHDRWARQGIRTLAIATRAVERRDSYTAEDERGMELAGFITLLDGPKADAPATLHRLAELGVGIKMITGDALPVATYIARSVGLDAERPLTGRDIHELTDVALVQAAIDTTVFAEVDPNQKERILRALRRSGAVVGFFGDGVNDTPAMHAADVSISVESAVDVAKATADLVLTRKSLDVIARGIEEGRRTFANTLKYILTTTSANLGNMISMAVASLALPFLPLTAGQILLNNFLSDVPAVGIATDSVDPELVASPRRWDTKFIGRFMLQFGLVSSAFDALTFGVLLFGFHASATEFRTGWFVESLFTELVIALVVRTRRRFWQSRPGRTLVWTTVVVAACTFALPYTPIGSALGFIAAPPALMLAVIAITAAYVVGSELMKMRFYRDARPPVVPPSPPLRVKRSRDAAAPRTVPVHRPS